MFYYLFFTYWDLGRLVVFRLCLAGQLTRFSTSLNRDRTFGSQFECRSFKNFINGLTVDTHDKVNLEYGSFCILQSMYFFCLFIVCVMTNNLGRDLFLFILYSSLILNKIGIFPYELIHIKLLIKRIRLMVKFLKILRLPFIN